MATGGRCRKNFGAETPCSLVAKRRRTHQVLVATPRDRRVLDVIIETPAVSGAPRSARTNCGRWPTPPIISAPPPWWSTACSRAA